MQYNIYPLATKQFMGKELGFLNSHEGNVKGRGSSYVNARLELVVVEFFDDVVPLIADLAKGFGFVTTHVQK
ncbi:hypothetical protein Leryth_006099 [Lithospermum erythrorhizon]|nr:hypothetical protein Leryth_006099 [Lithospermum erythrorhizon]